MTGLLTRIKSLEGHFGNGNGDDAPPRRVVVWASPASCGPSRQCCRMSG